MAFAVGIDVGGTFTDLVLSEDGGGLRLHKTPTTPADHSQSPTAAVAVAAA